MAKDEKTSFGKKVLYFILAGVVVRGAFYISNYKSPDYKKYQAAISCYDGHDGLEMYNKSIEKLKNKLKKSKKNGKEYNSVSNELKSDLTNREVQKKRMQNCLKKIRIYEFKKGEGYAVIPDEKEILGWKFTDMDIITDLTEQEEKDYKEYLISFNESDKN